MMETHEKNEWWDRYNVFVNQILATRLCCALLFCLHLSTVTFKHSWPWPKVRNTIYAVTHNPWKNFAKCYWDALWYFISSFILLFFKNAGPWSSKSISWPTVGLFQLAIPVFLSLRGRCVCRQVNEIRDGAVSVSVGIEAIATVNSWARRG